MAGAWARAREGARAAWAAASAEAREEAMGAAATGGTTAAATAAAGGERAVVMATVVGCAAVADEEGAREGCGGKESVEAVAAWEAALVGVRAAAATSAGRD